MSQVADSARGWFDRLRAISRTAGSGLLATRIVRDAWWLALVAIAVLQQVHAGLDEHRELSPLVHLLRDAALAVPAAAVAILIASTLAAGRRSASAAAPTAGAAPTSGVVERLLWVLVAAAVFAVLSVPGNQLHGALFGAEDEAELSWLADVALDAGIAFIGAVLALGPLAIVAGLPIRDPARTASIAIDPRRPGLETSARSIQ